MAFWILFWLLSLLWAVSLEFCARWLISSATTAKPLPASPALAASIEAFNARRFVWDAMETTSELFAVSSSKSSIISFRAFCSFSQKKLIFCICCDIWVLSVAFSIFPFAICSIEIWNFSKSWLISLIVEIMRLCCCSTDSLSLFNSFA